MKIPTLLSLLFLATSVFAQTPTTRLIIRADDMGYSHSGNEAILKCYKEGIATSVEIIAASPWFPEAVKMLTDNPSVDVGVHLAITSEWDNVKWRPLSDCPTLRDEDGYFFPMIRPNKNYPGRSVAENKWKIEDVEKEFRAQIELVKRKIPRATHVSSHMGCYMISPEVRAMVMRLGKEYGLMVDTGAGDVKSVGFTGPHVTSQEKAESFIKTLEDLEAGKTYIFVEHPGLDTPEVRAIHHIGYENVATDRQGVTDLFTNPRIQALIKKKGIQLIGHRDLK